MRNVFRYVSFLVPEKSNGKELAGSCRSFSLSAVEIDPNNILN
jgi:hypothetical protein